MDEMQHECNTKKAKPATSTGFRANKADRTERLLTFSSLLLFTQLISKRLILNML